MIFLCRRSSRRTQASGFYLLRASLSAPVFFIVLLCYLVGYCPRVSVGLALSQHNTIGRVFPCCISYLAVFAVYFFRVLHRSYCSLRSIRHSVNAELAKRGL